MLSLRFSVGLAALVALVVAGIDLRFAYIGVGSTDVAEVTRAAIGQMLGGVNPYGVGYAVSFPPGAPFAYGPLALLWYLPFPDPARLELAVSLVILILLGLRGRVLGLAIYATTPILLLLASDGSNDHSAGLLLLIGLVTAERLPRVGAFVIGLAIAFKPYALAWLPPLLLWGGTATALTALVGAGLFWLPALLVWGIGPILTSFQMADRVHAVPYYSLADALARFGLAPREEAVNLLRFAFGGLATLAVLLTVRSHRGVVLGGAAIFLATLFTGFWATFAYLAALAPVICWYIDDWVGLGERVRWPLDPWGRLAADFDRRWPREAAVGRAESAAGAQLPAAAPAPMPAVRASRGRAPTERRIGDHSPRRNG